MTTKFYNLDIDPNFTANSDYHIASQKAIKTALDLKQGKLVPGVNVTIDENNTISAQIPEGLIFTNINIDINLNESGWGYDYKYRGYVILEGMDESSSDRYIPIVIPTSLTTFPDLFPYCTLNHTSGPSLHVYSNVTQTVNVDVILIRVNTTDPITNGFTGGFPKSLYYTKEEIDNKIGYIEAALDSINGEVI